MSARTCYVCEKPIEPGSRAITDYVAGQDDEFAELVLEVLRHPTCEQPDPDRS